MLQDTLEQEIRDLSPAALDSSADRHDLVPKFYDPELIVSPPDNPIYTPGDVADLIESMREHQQLVPGWVCPSPELPPDKRRCLEGNRRLVAARALGRSFWAFDLGRFVPEVEWIQLTFQHNYLRRQMSRDEIAERAARYIELTGCTHGEAASHLKVSGPMLSRAFGERRIPLELRPRAAQLGPTIRTLIAAVPIEIMPKALDFAHTAGPDGRKPTRDEVAAFIAHRKKGKSPKRPKAKTVTLKHNGRSIAIAVGENDTAYAVTEDLKSLAAKLSKHGEVAPEGWPFLFR